MPTARSVRTSPRIIGLLALATTLGASALTGSDEPRRLRGAAETTAETRVAHEGTDDDGIAERARTATLMERKLRASQEILVGLVQGDLALVARRAESLEAVARHEAWKRHLDDAVFQHFNVEFQRVAQKLARLAEDDNVEGSVYVYNRLTGTCVSCHQHVRDVKRVPTIRRLDGERRGRPAAPPHE